MHARHATAWPVLFMTTWLAACATGPSGPGRETQTAQALTVEAQARIAERDPVLHAVVEINPEALAIAAALDAERAEGRMRGPLHGQPVLLKDNIDTGDALLTTAGSLALTAAPASDDAFLVRRLRDAGLVVLGKTNLSEWANFRSTEATSGWSARGGQTVNPYGENRNPCGSSAGSAVAVAAGMVRFAVGTETNGSIVCPASANGVVGIKPSVGMVSRDGLVPISVSQDTAGPLARTVGDAALLLQAMAAIDSSDPAFEPEHRVPDFAAALNAQALQGVRIGVVRSMAGFDAATDAVFDDALQVLRKAGATLVDVTIELPGSFDDDSFTVLLHEFRDGINAYLATRAGVPPDLAALIAFNDAHADTEMPHFGQDIFQMAVETAGRGDPAYREAHARTRRSAGPDGIDATLARHDLIALVAPTMAPAWQTDWAAGDAYVGGGAASIAAVAGYPHISVPMGAVNGLPVGLSFFGEAWSDARLIGLAYAYEQAAGVNLRPPGY